MTTAPNYRRPAFPNRPWITGKLYDDYSRDTIMHMDAYILSAKGRTYLLIDFRRGGTFRIAVDAWLIEQDGLTPIWDAVGLQNVGEPVYWSRANHAWMRGVHQTVLAQAEKMMGFSQGRWTRVVTQCHYVHVTDTDCEIRDNKYVERARPLMTPGDAPTFEQLVAGHGKIGKRRGRPVGSKNKAREARLGVTTEEALTVRKTLPDWL